MQIQLGHQNGDVTTVNVPYEPGHKDLDLIADADHDQLNDESKARRGWLLSLPEDQRRYFMFLYEIDHLWPSHSALPPEWVECPDPALEDMLADHFSVRGHECAAGRPNEKKKA